MRSDPARSRNDGPVVANSREREPHLEARLLADGHDGGLAVWDFHDDSAVSADGAQPECAQRQDRELERSRKMTRVCS